MTGFASALAALPRLAPLDPTKHVKYTLGMVLGVDDFDQEFAYLSASRSVARARPHRVRHGLGPGRERRGGVRWATRQRRDRRRCHARAASWSA